MTIGVGQEGPQWQIIARLLKPSRRSRPSSTASPSKAAPRAPTQGNDRGASYRSAIFTTNPEQKAVAENTIADVDASGLLPGRVVTEVALAGPFWLAEPKHQDYLERYPGNYTCHFVRLGWNLPRPAAA